MSLNHSDSRRALVTWLLLFAVTPGCGFPSHRFVADDEFERELDGGLGGMNSQDGRGGATGGGATGGGATGGEATGGGATGGEAMGGEATGGEATGGEATGGEATGGEATGGTGSGGDGPGVEICDNGLDDDSDGDVDCVDADCDADGWGCAPVVPEGWEGPVALFTGGIEVALPECRQAGSYAVARYAGLLGDLSTEPGACPGCECGAPEGTTASVQISYRSGSSCSGECAFGTELCRATFPEGCSPVVLKQTSLTGSLPLTLTVDAVEPTAGQCPPITGDQLPPSPPTHAMAGLACASSRGVGSCGEEGICVPRPASPFESGPCLVAVGDLACPAGYGARRQVLYTAVEDQRQCTACACGSASGFDQSVDVVEYDGDTACDGQRLGVGSVAGCVTPSVDLGLGQDTRHLQVTVESSGGRCEPTLSSPLGSVAVTGDTLTFCCTTP
jgi:hypothetical protein